MLVQDVMTIYPIYITLDVNMRRAAEIISISQVSDLMVVDANRDFVGVLSEGDLINAILPNFDEVIEAGGTLSDAFRFFQQRGQELADQPIAPLVLRDCIRVKRTDEVASVATIMVQEYIRLLPVIENEKLIGTISRADICRSVLFQV